MVRTLPPLPTFAAEVAHALGGTAHALGEAAAAIALGDEHPLLVRDHGWTLTLSLPTASSWPMRTPEEWRAAEPEIREALARRSPQPTISDAIVEFAPVLAAATGSPWDVRFPGTPVPTEAWMANGGRSVGLLQQRTTVKVVVWVGEMMHSKTAATGSFSKLVPWLEEMIPLQQQALDDAEAEKRRKAALPVPDVDAVIALLRAGERIRVSGGRYHETYFWDGRLSCAVFDEGDSYERDATEAELRRNIEAYPDVFRSALAQGPGAQIHNAAGMVKSEFQKVEPS
jgi:hypothetical protein